MRWLDKTYKMVLEAFCGELKKSGLKEAEIDVCIDLASKDLGGGDLYRNLASNG